MGAPAGAGEWIRDKVRLDEKPTHQLPLSVTYPCGGGGFADAFPYICLHFFALQIHHAKETVLGAPSDLKETATDQVRNPFVLWCVLSSVPFLESSCCRSPDS